MISTCVNTSPTISTNVKYIFSYPEVLGGAEIHDRLWGMSCLQLSKQFLTTSFLPAMHEGMTTIVGEILRTPMQHHVNE
jgi:hypothetical protein